MEHQREYTVMTQHPCGTTQAMIFRAASADAAKKHVKEHGREAIWTLPEH